jgi:hypothetical protein
MLWWTIIDRLLQQDTQKMQRVSINKDREDGRAQCNMLLPECSVGYATAQVM